MTELQKIYDVIIIGGGPGGYVAAIRAAQHGGKVCLIEKENVGGNCLNVGCVPTKALYQSAELYNKVKTSEEFGLDIKDYKLSIDRVIERKQKIVNQLVDGVKYLIIKHKIKLVNGNASFIDKQTVTVKTNSGEEKISGRNIIIATGSVNAAPPIPGANGKDIIDSTVALELKNIPKKLIIIGGGVIGCEFAAIYNAFGSEVSIIEVLPGLLNGMDSELTKCLEKIMLKDKINLYLGSKVTKISDDQGKKAVEFQNETGNHTISGDKIIIATGRRPNLYELNLDRLGLNYNKAGIIVNEYLQTNIQHIYAIGDVNGRVMLAHVAYEEAEVAVENIFGIKKEINYSTVPKTVFTFPEISSVGLTEEEAKNKYKEIVIGKYPLLENGKSIIIGETDGFIKVIADKNYHKILGFHLVGPHASELIAEATLAVNSELTLEDIEGTIHSHPSVSEAIKESVLSAIGKPLHSSC